MIKSLSVIKRMLEIILRKNKVYLNKGWKIAILAGFHLYLGKCQKDGLRKEVKKDEEKKFSYLVFAATHNFKKAEPLLSMVGIIWVVALYYKILQPKFGFFFNEKVMCPIDKIYEKAWKTTRVKYYLLSSTVMSAPGSLACSKMLYPETEDSQIKNIEDLELPDRCESNPLECIANGALSAVHLVTAIAVNLIVFLALLALLDSVLEFAADLIGYNGWSFEVLVGYIFFPVAYIMGVNEDNEQTLRVAQLMGTKTVLNEFIAYQRLGQMMAQDPPLISPRSAMIATYALCGFSNFSSVGIVLGILGILVQHPLRCTPVDLQANCFNVSQYQANIIESPMAFVEIYNSTKIEL
uniref:Nucleos_tra2_C domain-containing protein n=1 Tax=Heterorhabditis bacteriophora TaxID=37862 RepID=A0A1I7WE74_HETBA